MDKIKEPLNSLSYEKDLEIGHKMVSLVTIDLPKYVPLYHHQQKSKYEQKNPRRHVKITFKGQQCDHLTTLLVF